MNFTVWYVLLQEMLFGKSMETVVTVMILIITFILVTLKPVEIFYTTVM